MVNSCFSDRCALCSPWWNGSDVLGLTARQQHRARSKYPTLQETVSLCNYLLTADASSRRLIHMPTLVPGGSIPMLWEASVP